MMHFINFKEYTPDVLGGVGDKSILWIKSENGNDWYECQHLFASDTVKVMYDKSGVIRAAGFDVSAGVVE